MPITINLAAEDGNLARVLQEFVAVLNLAEREVAKDEPKTVVDTSKTASELGAEPTKPLDGEIIPPAKKTRAKKDDKPKADEAQVDLEEAIAETYPPATVDEVRKALLDLSATEGLGREKVYEILKEVGAKTASSVPEDKRGYVVAKVKQLIEGVKS